ncbi:MAG: transposase [Candidatus Bipolaricaulis sp.]|nr:transposase [Candidatus Bipolaricaulis sp.]MDD5219695.1 transposase [Candidatus Bipolaricaulis sp.]MDD5647004.1 transposase [Candidatus Bipolaricaulis sp.]
MTRDEASTYATFRKRRSLRLSSHDYTESRPYHVTWGTHHGRPILLADTARAVAECIEAEARRTPADLYAYCVMPDHVHVLVVPRGGGNVIRFVQAVKSRTAHIYSSLGGTEKLWQRGFYDRIVRKEEDIAHLAEYILANPVRAGVAEDASAYPFSRLFPS